MSDHKINIKEETDFQVGDECIYSEDLGETRCKILERDVQNGLLFLKLEAIETLTESPMVEAMENGKVFEVDKVIGASVPGILWEIREVL